MRDVAKYLTSKQASSSPDMAAQWAKLESMYNKKLWHQLTVELFDFVRQPGVQDELVQLYENFIADFENKYALLIRFSRGETLRLQRLPSRSPGRPRRRHVW